MTAVLYNWESASIEIRLLILKLSHFVPHGRVHFYNSLTPTPSRVRFETESYYICCATSCALVQQVRSNEIPHVRSM